MGPFSLPKSDSLQMPASSDEGGWMIKVSSNLTPFLILYTWSSRNYIALLIYLEPKSSKSRGVWALDDPL